MQIRLRNILMERGINVKTMAEALGVDITSIPVYDRFAPSMESMKRMADWLQIPTWELFCDCGTSSWQMFQHVVKEPLMERFARRLKELARERHMPLNVVAERAGMSKANLSLSMKRNITTSTIEKIARALEIEDKTYLLFITPAEYDAIYRGVGAINNEAGASGSTLGTEANEPRADVNEMGTEPDLFTQIEEEPHEQTAEDDGWKALPDGCYAYGNVRIELFHGRITISEKPKPH